MTPETVLSLAGVSYTYPGSESPALSGINLDIRRGEIVFVTGPTGAGKTTLCLAASGILHHDYGGTLEGSMTILGKDVRDYPVWPGSGETSSGLRRRSPAIFSTVEEEVASDLRTSVSPVRRCKEAPPRDGGDRIVDLADRAPHTSPAGRNSGRHRRNLALGTEILILDEPTAELMRRPR